MIANEKTLHKRPDDTEIQIFKSGLEKSFKNMIFE